MPRLRADPFQSLVKLLRRRWLDVFGTQRMILLYYCAQDTHDILAAAMWRDHFNAVIADHRGRLDGGVDLIVQVKLSDVTDALVPDAGAQAGSGSAGDTTGVIINAKGLKVTPALAPRLIDEKGNEVYTAKHVSKDAIGKNGVCGYVKTVDAANKDPRVTGKPLVLKALRLTEAGSADLVLSEADAAKLTKLGAILGKGNVVIVTD